MQKITILILTFCVIFLFLGLMPVHGEAEIYDSVLRLHVIANSNSDEDQQLKFKVRDKILEAGTSVFAESSSKSEAVSEIEKNITLLEAIARETVKENGYSYPVKIELGNEKYPTKSYDSFCFPAGEYLSLRIIIGEGKGENWWCVLFPPMCISAAAQCSPEEQFISVGLDKDQYGIITETEKPVYKARFRLLEVIEDTIGG